MISEPKAHASGEGEICSVRRLLPFAKKFATLRPGWQTRPPLVGSVLPWECWTPRSFVRATGVLAVRGQRLPRSFLRVFDLFFGAPADQSQEVLEIASGVGLGLAISEHGPCFVGGTVTLDGVSFTTRFAIHSGRGCHRGTWRSSILFSPKPSSDVTSWIVCFW